MADFVKIHDNTMLWIGASTDTKPALCPNGAIAYEYDTKRYFITHNTGSTWSDMP